MSTGAVGFRPPPRPVLQALWTLMNVWFPTRVSGLEQYDGRRPALFVGNHTIYGVIDIPLIVSAVYLHSGQYLRGLGDHIHFRIPGWRRLITGFGGVEGTRPNCSALMQAQQSILVYPGGGREVMKRKGEAYTLIWKQRLGFARMAIQHGYDIVPFASVGAEECYDILLDAEDILRTPVGRLLEYSGLLAGPLRNGEGLPPLARGIGPTAIPRPQPFYLQFGAAISTAQLQGLQDDEQCLWRLREQVADRIHALIALGRAQQAGDRQPGRLRRWLTR